MVKFIRNTNQLKMTPALKDTRLWLQPCILVLLTECSELFPYFLDQWCLSREMEQRG